ncbi:hypothetical protein CWATWH0402_3687 [Crocosphaera watsonii WH 0402]|uniref:Uncharacterized protein n=1 Tax=Crocosphaera watsonii WH 0402 TaxID=1284629 RepID=T2JT33_CROWT|nr:hypothetical protein CWATWH0402_3687 [Crocosphaera watsonii WH 0402]
MLQQYPDDFLGVKSVISYQLSVISYQFFTPHTLPSPHHPVTPSPRHQRLPTQVVLVYFLGIIRYINYEKTLFFSTRNRKKVCLWGAFC